jgi:hypothetical protein
MSAPMPTATASVTPARLQQARQVRGHRRADEPRRRERDGEEDGGTLRRLLRRRCRSGRGRRRDRRRPGTRQREVERDADDEMERGPAEAGAAPAEVRLEQRRERPADRAREAGDQRDAGDRAARAGAVEPDQRRERGFVEAAAHADAEHRPGEKEAPRSLRKRERGQPDREDEVGAGEDEAPAPAIDRAADVRTERGRDEQRDRECREHGRWCDAEVARDRRRQHRRQVVRRPPGQGLRAAQREDGGELRVRHERATGYFVPPSPMRLPTSV